MRIAVVDDNEKDAEYLLSCIRRCGMEQGLSFETVLYADAVDYILKPISYPGFKVKMQKALRYVERSRDCPINLKTTEGYVKLMISDIYYVESDLHYLLWHTRSGEYRLRGRLSETEEQLAPYHFSRCSASFLVNLRYVEAMKGNDVTVAGRALPISRSRKAQFISDFTRYMGGIA